MSLKIGTNMTPICNWQSDRKFADLLHPLAAYYPPRSVCPQATWDAAGVWPTSLGKNEHYGWILASTLKYVSPGRYRVTAKGTGTLWFDHPDAVTARNGKKTFDVKGNGDGRDHTIFEFDLKTTASQFFTSIWATDPKDPLRDVRFFHVEDDPYQLFSKQFLASLKGYDTLRFMQWAKISGSKETEWPKFAGAPGGIGARWAAAIALCNQVRANCWISTPHLASDDYLAKLGSLINNTLRKDLAIYVEYSNECWNWSPPYAVETAYVDALAKQQKPPIPREAMQVTLQKRHADAIKAAAPGHKVVSVFCSQFANPYLAQIGLEYAAKHNCVPDAIGCAPYVDTIDPVKKNFDWPKVDAMWLSPDPAAKDFAIQYVFDAYRAYHATNDKFVQQYRALADKYHIPLLAYEGGPGWAIYEQAWNAEIVPSWDQARTSGRGIVVVGIDTTGVLHVRAFDAGGTTIRDADESRADPKQEDRLDQLRDRAQHLAPPHVLAPAEKTAIIDDVKAVFGLGQCTPAYRYELYEAVRTDDRMQGLITEFLEWQAKYFDGPACYYCHTFDWGDGQGWGAARHEGEPSPKLRAIEAFGRDGI